MLMPSKFLAKHEINGKDVSFFSPPHDEPDFIWVDVQELVAAFVTPDRVARMVDHVQRFSPTGDRMVTTVRNGDRIATIMCHAMAQGFCGFIDVLNGYPADDHGPAHNAYCLASAKVEIDHGSLSVQDIGVAFHNSGGPFMRSTREDHYEPDGPTAA